MDEVFNPYYAFLGLDEEVTSPGFYQILRLRETECDAAKINAAADKATARARACRPGANAVEWSRLLDEIQAARTCLLDPAQRAAYDQQQRATDGSAEPESAGRAPNGQPTNPAALAAPAISFVAPSSTNFAYPPGAGPQPMASQATVSPVAPVVNPTPAYAPENPAYAPNPAYPANPNTAHAANPAMAPYSPAPTFSPSPTPAYPQYGGYAATMPAPAWNPPASQNDPMAPMAYSWTPPTQPPAGPMLAPPIAPASNPLDPMAPVAYAAQPESRPTVAASVAFASAAPMAVPKAVPVHQAAPVASVVVPSRPATRPAKRPAKFPVALAIGIGGLSFLLVVLVIAWSMQGGLGQPIAERPDPSEPIEPDPSTPPPIKPKPERVKPAKPTPEPPEEEMPKEEMPQDDEPDEEMPAPENPAKPTPSPEPEPAPEPTKPEPPKPESTPRPTPAELAELSRLMKEAKTALGDFSFEEADEALAKAEQAAKLPEHKAVVQRLKAVAGMAKTFRGAIQETMFKLEAGEVIKVGSTTEAAIVEASPNKLIIRIAGQNRTYTLDDLPLGLAANLGDRALNPENPTTRLLKGAYVFIDKRSDPAQLKKAKTWWEEAQLNGADIGGLLPVFTDNYDFKSEATPE